MYEKKQQKKSAAGKGGRSSPLVPIMAVLLALAAAVGLYFTLQKLREDRFGYPRKFETEVLASCEKFGLEPSLVFAVIRTESSFRPEAVSRAGAQGLMQLMPQTADWAASRQRLEHDEARIFEPDYNIDLGCCVLSYLLERYDGDMTLALAAYNAGASRVDSWLASDEYYDGETLNIPYAETRNYVKKVLDAYEKYKNQQ